MPAKPACDFGDTMRPAANDYAGDEPALRRVHFSLPLYEAFAVGLLAGCGAA